MPRCLSLQFWELVQGRGGGGDKGGGTDGAHNHKKVSNKRNIRK